MSLPGNSRRRVFTAINGVLLLDKASGITSNRALQQVRHLFGAAKAGHTGTLDPLCSGLLPICIGEATKFSGFHLAADKRYRATLLLGVTTASGDAEGAVMTTRAVNVNAVQIAAALDACRGPQTQIPPMYSALKRDGKPLYEYARKGVEVERAPRAIEVFDLNLIERNGDSLTVDVHCTKGTYIRVLAEKIGEILGCGAHLTALRRTASGDFSLADATTFDQLTAMDPVQRSAALLPVDSLLRAIPAITLSATDAHKFALGQAIACAAAADGTLRVYAPQGDLLGVGTCSAGALAPKRLIATH